MGSIRKWMYLNKRIIKYICLGIVILLIVIDSIYIINENKNRRKIIYEDYNVGKKFEYLGVNYTFKNLELLTVREIMERYDLEEDDLPPHSDITMDSRYAIVTYEIEKLDEEAKGFSLYDATLKSLTDNVFFEQEFLMSTQPDFLGVMEMEVSEKQMVEVPFPIHEELYTEEMWDNMKAEDFIIWIPDVAGKECITRVHFE